MMFYFLLFFPTIKLSHPEAGEEISKIVFEVFFASIYRLGRKDGETEVK